MAGSWGRCGVLLDVTIKLAAKPRREITRSFQLDPPAAREQLARLIPTPAPLSASCYVDGVLHLRFSGSETAVSETAAALGGDAGDDELWSSLRDQTHPFFHMGSSGLWRVAV